MLGSASRRSEYFSAASTSPMKPTDTPAQATDLIHGANATQEAIRASEILFGGELAGVSETTFNDIVGEVPTKELEKSKLDGSGLPLVELLVHSGLCPSKGQARKDRQ